MDFFGPIPISIFFHQSCADTDFLEPIFGADSAFCSLDLHRKNDTMMITKVTKLSVKYVKHVKC